MNDLPPLYSRVRATMVERLVARTWRPGEALPAETRLARDLGVSQGTLRKAIDSLCAEGALRRIQGRGTFVAEQTPELANFRFFRLSAPDGARIVPALLTQSAAEGAADAAAAAALGIAEGAGVHILDRVRSVDGRPAILERVVAPDSVMPGLSHAGPLPNALYPHYQALYGIHIVRTEDSLTAISADARRARLLGMPHGTPLLRAERVAIDLSGRAVEYRVSEFLTLGCTFRVELG